MLSWILSKADCIAAGCSWQPGASRDSTKPKALQPLLFSGLKPQQSSIDVRHQDLGLMSVYVSGLFNFLKDRDLK